jgi:DNA-binding beta-propeller fold protein YncE
MRPHSPIFSALFVTAALSFALLNPVQATPQKKKKKQAQNSPPSVTQQTGQPQPVQPQPVQPTDHATPDHTAAAPLAAEKDPQREAWRIQAEPYAILGSGHPGKAVSDFDKPDGVAFTPQGWLLATDAKNRRVQIWDVKTKAHLGEFGHGILGGEIVDIAVAPSGMVLVTDQVLNLAYAFMPAKPGDKDDKGKPLGPYDYVFKGTRFGERHYDKLGGIAIDSKGRVYAVDAHLNEVFRYTPDGASDQSWQFAKQRGDGDTYLHGCEGIAIDEAAGNIYIASEKDSTIQVFDWETGAYKSKLVGARSDGSGKPLGKSIFSGAVEGLAIANKTLFAVDESVGHIQIFDLNSPGVFNHDLLGFGPTQRARNGGYKGFVGHSPQVDFEDKTNKALQQQVKDGTVIPGQANPPGYFCSPDSIATHTLDGETYIAVADQCNYRLAVYRWSDIARAFGSTAAANITRATPAPTTQATEPAPAVSGKGGGKKKGKKKGQ